MPTEPKLELEALLAPIPGDAPVGVDLRADETANSLYYRLRTMRQECRDGERAADSGDPDAAPPKWEEMMSGCEAALKEKTKDFEVACWIIEAQARINGFAGLRDGFKLANGLCAQYWDTLYSVQDESDPTAKGEPLGALNGKGREGALIPPIRKIPLTPKVEPGPFAYWQCELQQKKKEMGEIETLARQAGRKFYEPLLGDIAEARTAFAELSETMRAKMDSASPPTTAIREALEQIQDMVQQISGIKLSDAPPTTAAAAGEDAGAGVAGTASRRADGSFATRDHALTAIMEIARYFREREPHSPISYTLEDAVRRARMPLNELLMELLDDDARRRMLLNAGIMPPVPPAPPAA